MAKRSSRSDGRHRVVVVGGGFGGMYAAKSIRDSAVDVVLVDKRNFHLFQPLLYQVATGGLSPADIAHPHRSVLKRHRNVTVRLDEVVGFDLAKRLVTTKDGELEYDSLIVAAGAVNHYFGHGEWQRHAPGLKSVEEATEIRSRVLRAFEAAESEPDPVRREALLTFVVVGGGATGVELAGALGEIAKHTLKHDFRVIRPSDAKILLVEGADRLLLAYKPKLAERAAYDLASIGVEVRTGIFVEGVDADGVTLRKGEALERIAAHTAIWAAGVRASPLAEKLAEAGGVKLDRQGRVPVTPSLEFEGFHNVFVIGDMAACLGADGKPLPGVAPVAMQQGAYVARTIETRVSGGDTGPFHYRDRGSMATIGRSRAIADLGWVAFGGFPAWVTWLFVHLMYLVEFENRVLVLFQWSWNYFTWNRGARLITGESDERGSGQRGSLSAGYQVSPRPSGVRSSTFHSGHSMSMCRVFPVGNGSNSSSEPQK